jgi:hypothetical protein
MKGKNQKAFHCVCCFFLSHSPVFSSTVGPFASLERSKWTAVWHETAYQKFKVFTYDKTNKMHSIIIYNFTIKTPELQHLSTLLGYLDVVHTNDLNIKLRLCKWIVAYCVHKFQLNLLSRNPCCIITYIINVYFLQMRRIGSKHVAVEVLVF